MKPFPSRSNTRSPSIKSSFVVVSLLGRDSSGSSSSKVMRFCPTPSPRTHRPHAQPRPPERARARAHAPVGIRAALARTLRIDLVGEFLHLGLRRVLAERSQAAAEVGQRNGVVALLVEERKRLLELCATSPCRIASLRRRTALRRSGAPARAANGPAICASVNTCTGPGAAVSPIRPTLDRPAASTTHHGCRSGWSAAWTHAAQRVGQQRPSGSACAQRNGRSADATTCMCACACAANARIHSC